MRIVHACIITPLILLLLVNSAFAKSSDQRTIRTEKLWAEIEQISLRLSDVWNKEIKAAIRFVYIRSNNVDDLDLTISRTCDWQPHLEFNQGAPRVVYGQPLILVSQYLQQAILLYLFDDKLSLQPAQIDEYVQNVLAPIVRHERKKCTRGLLGNKSRMESAVPSILHGKLDPSAYTQKLNNLRERDIVRVNADLVAGLPIFYALLHEAGHYALNHESKEWNSNFESEADKFASRVFAGNSLSVILGIGHLQLFYFGQYRDLQLRCRIAKIAINDRVGKETFLMPPSHFTLSQFNKLRDFYVNSYGLNCH